MAPTVMQSAGFTCRATRPHYTGQNVCSVQPIMGSLRHELMVQFALPHLVLLATCRAADASFVVAPPYWRAISCGDALYQNVQFADYATVPDEMKAQTLDIVCASVHGVQVRSNGGKIVTFDIRRAVERHCSTLRHDRRDR